MRLELSKIKPHFFVSLIPEIIYFSIMSFLLCLPFEFKRIKGDVVGFFSRKHTDTAQNAYKPVIPTTTIKTILITINAMPHAYVTTKYTIKVRVNRNYTRKHYWCRLIHNAGRTPISGLKLPICQIFPSLVT